MTTKLYSQPDNHRQALTGKIRRSRSLKIGLVLVGHHGQAKILLLGEDRKKQPTLSGFVGENIQISGIWKRGILHFWPDDFSAVNELPTVDLSEEPLPTEEDIADLIEETPNDRVLQMISNMEKVPHVERTCPKCNAKSKHFVKYCWGCGFAFAP